MNDVGFLDAEPFCTQEDFARFAEEHENDRDRFELLNGRIVMTPPPAWPHSEMTLLLARVVGNFVYAKRIGRVLENGSVALPSGDTPGPDILVATHESWRRAGPPAAGAIPRVVPDVVVEVLSESTSSYDRGEKKAIYERNGVREYWLVDSKKPRIARYLLDAGRYGVPVIFEIDDVFESVVLDGLRFAVREIVPEP
jgi:Uma2 family endonuclease